MKKALFACSILFLALFMMSCAQPEQEPAVVQPSGIPVEEIFDYAAQQLTKSVASNQDPEAFPFYTDKETGEWVTQDDSWWASGFFAGCLWLMYDYSGDLKWEESARKFTDSMENQLSDTNDSDIGYRIMNSYGNAYSLTGDEKYREGLIQAAGSLATRYNQKVAAIKAYEMDQYNYPILVDHMMNLELLYKGVTLGGDAGWKDMCVEHSKVTALTCIREDGSTIQLVDLDSETGDVLGHHTLCGLSGDSAWSRGQGEAIYGFAIGYRETGIPEFLETAKVLADYFLANLPADKAAYWDMKDPDIPNVIRDTSASSMTADGLLEMCSLMPDGAERDKYYQAAVDILQSLWDNYSTRGTNSQGILDHASFQGKDAMGADTSLVFGDCNFLSAVLKYKRMQ